MARVPIACRKMQNSRLSDFPKETTVMRPQRIRMFGRYLSLFHHGNRRERMNLAFGDDVLRRRCVFFVVIGFQVRIERGGVFVHLEDEQVVRVFCETVMSNSLQPGSDFILAAPTSLIATR